MASNDFPLGEGESVQRGVGEGQVGVLVELLRQLSPLESEEPEAIMRLFVRLHETYELGLVEDRVFIVKSLPLFSGSVLGFVGRCLQQRKDWKEFKASLLEEYFPHFVRERLIRNMITFHFHQEGEPLRMYVEKIVRAAKFFEYQASEEQIVGRVVMNLHPKVLAYSALLDRPKTFPDLHRIIGLIEEKAAVEREIKGGGAPLTGARNSRMLQSRFMNSGVGRSGNQVTLCWDCGQTGHLRRSCPQRSGPSGNGVRPGGQLAPGPDS
jgi:hypothetical protein